MEQPQRTRLAQHVPFDLSPTLNGKTKSDFELVVARYDEDISWTDNYSQFRTVYNKGKDISGVDYIPLENKGHLADTILRHIISRYNSLASTTFFAHGSINYRKDQQFTQSIWNEFCIVGTTRLKYLADTQMPSPRGHVYTYPETWNEVHTRLFGTSMKGSSEWSRGSWISVGRSCILGRPKAFWERWLAWVNSDMPDGSKPTLDDYRNRDIYIERLLVKALRTRG